MKTQNKEKSLAGHVREGFSGKLLSNCLNGNQEQVSVFNSIENQQKLQSALLTAMKPAPKVVRLHRCFGCKGNFGIKKMSKCLIFCRGCFAAAQDKKQTARRNFIDRALNDCRIFLGGFRI